MFNNLLGLLVPYPLHIEQVRSIPHPQFSYRWVALLPNLLKISFPLEKQSPPSFPVPIVESTDLPFMSASSKGITEGAQEFFVADKYSMKTVGMSLYTDQYGLTLSYIKAWKDMVRNPDRTFNYPVEYKYDILILWVLNSAIPYVGFKLKGAFPLSTDVDRLYYERVDRIVINQEFSVDDVEIFNPTDHMKAGIVEFVKNVFSAAPTATLP